MSRALLVDAVGVAAAVCSMASFVPQVAKIIKARDASAVSLRMYVVTVIGFSLWAVYGALLHSWPLIVANLISLSLAALVLGLKVLYRGTAPAPATKG